MKPNHDMRHHRHPRFGKRGEGGLEIGDRTVEMIDLADRLLGADDVDHRHIDAAFRHLAHILARSERRMDRDAEPGKIALETGEHRIISPVGHFVAPIRASREKKAAQPLPRDHLAHHGLEMLGRARRDHRLEDLRLAVVAIERAPPAGDGEGREVHLAATLEFFGGVGAETRGEEAERGQRTGKRLALERLDQFVIERDVGPVLERGDPFTPRKKLTNRCGHGDVFLTLIA